MRTNLHEKYDYPGTAANVGMLTIQRTAGLSARNATERMRIFSWLGVAPSFANVLGPVAVGLMIDGAGFAAGYGLMLLLPLGTLWTMRQVPRQHRGAAPAPAALGSAWSLLRLPGMRRLLLVNWVFSMSWDVHTFAVPVLGHERGYSATTIGLVLGTFTLSVTGVRLLIPALAHRLREVTVVRGAMVATAVIFLAYPLAQHPVAMGGLAVLLGLSLGCTQPMVMSMLHRLTPDGRYGQALGLRSMAINGSSTAMPLLFGLAGATLGAAVLFWAVAAALAVTTAVTKPLARDLGES